ncbi:MAG: cupin domain-containing protein [Actinomycetota bacterium]
MAPPPGHVFHAAVRDLVTPPAQGTLSVTVHGDDAVKVVAFGFAAGEELSEHTSTLPAIIEVVSGHLVLTLGGEERDAPAGAWALLDPGLPHAVRALEPSVMLLTLVRAAREPL